MRVLILDGDSRAALECAQSLARRGGHVTLSCEADDCAAFHSRCVRERLRQPPPGPRALDWLRSRHAQNSFDVVIPCTERSLQWLRGLGRDESLRARASLPVNAALDALADRQALLTHAAALGIPTLDSSSGRYRALCIGLLMDRGRPAWHFAHERLHERPLTGGTSTYRRSVTPPARLLAYAERLLHSVEWHGAAMAEFRGPNPDEARLVALHPGLWPSLGLAIDCGVDFPWGLARLALGGGVPPQPDYRVGYYTRDPLGDAAWQLENWRADHRDPRLLTRSRLASALELLRPLVGRESWDHFDWKDPGVTAHALAMGTRGLTERVAGELQRRQWRRRALRQHRALLRDTWTRPERLLLVCRGEATRCSQLIGELARCGPGARASSPRLVRAEVEQAQLVLCASMEDLMELHRLFPHASARATLLGLFATPRSLELADPQSAVGHLCEWLSTLPRARLPGLRSAQENGPRPR